MLSTLLHTTALVAATVTVVVHVSAISGHVGPCLSVLHNGTTKDGTNICPWENVNASFWQQLDAFRNINIAFVGDSRTRYLFWYIKCALVGQPAVLSYGNQKDYHYYMKSRNVTLNFYWMEYPDQRVASLVEPWTVGHQPAPQYVVWGVAAWTAQWRHHQAGVVRLFAADVAKGTKTFTQLPRTTLIWLDILPVRKLMWNDNPSIAVTLDKLQETTARAGRSFPTYAFWSSARTAVLLHMEQYIDSYHFAGPLLQQYSCLFLAAVNPANC